MFDLTQSELFVIGFITAAVVSAPLWPRLGTALGRLLAGEPPPEDRRAPRSGDPPQLS